MHLETYAKLLENSGRLFHYREIRVTPHENQYFRVHILILFLILNIAGETIPIFASLKLAAVPSTPKPYFTLLLKFIEKLQENILSDSSLHRS